MKQHITNGDFFQLSERAQDKFNEWAKDKAFGEKITIGILIEFLREYYKKFDQLANGEYMTLTIGGLSNRELIEDLWQAVKEILEKES